MSLVSGAVAGVSSGTVRYGLLRITVSPSFDNPTAFPDKIGAVLMGLGWVWPRCRENGR
jgi:hypothetical protein